MIDNITLIGAGNLATQIGIAFKEQKIKINQVYSRSIKSAKKLGEKLNCDFTNKIDKVHIKQLGVICVKDDLIKNISKKISDLPIVHTSGSTNISVLKKFTDYGVIYPIQTFNKNSKIKFQKIPFCVEANNLKFQQDLTKLCKTISKKVVKITSEERLKIHIAAVMSNNFTNHIISRAQKILKKNNLPLNLLNPLIQETFRKIKSQEANLIQTGPAIRKDIKTIKKHIDKLEGLDKKIYNIISKQIMSNDK